MNAVFELEVPQNSPAVAEAISIFSNWFVAREQQAYFQNLIIIIIITLLLSKFWLFKLITIFNKICKTIKQ